MLASLTGAGASAGAIGTARSSRLDGNPEGTGAPFATTSPLNPSTTAGGTLNVGISGDVDYLDPGRTYYAFSWDLHQLFNRTLLTYPDGTGNAALKPTADIATGPAVPADGDRTWSYTLQSGVRFQDGTPVTAKSIKYAIERTFATSVINGGPTYFATFLCPGGEAKDGQCHSYGGPYHGKKSRYGLSTITTPDAEHIIFHLNQPFAEWNYVMTLLGTSPVEVSVDQKRKTGGANYNDNVQATGPYEIASYKANKHIDLVRNPQWDATTDGTRSALPDAINITTSFDENTLDKDLIKNTQDLDIGGTGVQPNSLQKILADPSLSARTLDPITGFVRYLAILRETTPFNNVHCRRAIEYATDRSEQKLARGGSYQGAIATTMEPPTLAGWKNFNEYPGTQTGNAKRHAAKVQLKKCGTPHGFKTTIVTLNTGRSPQQAEFLRDDLRRIGIRAKIKIFDPATYYSSVVGVPANIKHNHYGLAFAAWGQDWAAPYGYFENIVDPRKILPQGNSNYGACSDPKIATLIDKAERHQQLSGAIHDWRRVDKLVNKQACDVPLTYDKAVDLFSDRLTNAYIEPAYGIVDLRAVGVA
jgi:peptide/nickel transport system substrate-binding protein